MTFRRAANVGIAALSVIQLACAPRQPMIEGRPAAPPTPDSYWRPPADAVPAPTKATMPSAVPDLRSMTLADVVDLSLRSNPATKVSWSQALAAADEYGATRGSLYPSFTGDVSASRLRALQSQSRASGDRWTYGPSILVNYLIFDFGGRSGRIDIARKTAVAASLTHNVTVQNSILATEAAVYNYLGTRALREGQQKVVDEAKANLAAATDRHEVGMATIADVLQAQTALSQAQLTLESLDGSLDIARGIVAVGMGLPATTQFEVPDVPVSDSVSLVSESVDSLIALAERARPDLGAARAQVAAAAANVKAAKSTNRPSLAFTSNTAYNGSSTVLGSGNTYNLNLALQVPIFTGFTNEYRTREAQDQLLTANARAEQARQQIDLQVLTAYTGLHTATRRVRTAADLLASAQQSETVALARYREGVGSIVDLLVAQAALADARAQSIQARWQWRQALAQLSHDVGTLGIHGEPLLKPIDGR
jgi:outer membrane protein TolC